MPGFTKSKNSDFGFGDYTQLAEAMS